MATFPELQLYKNASSRVKALELTASCVQLLDQNALPHLVRYLEILTPLEMADAIVTMKVRGAPAIGIAAAYGVVLSTRCHLAMRHPIDVMIAEIRRDAERLLQTRPTAVNLSWALSEMETILEQSHASGEALLEALTVRALSIHEQDIMACQQIGAFGAPLVPKGATILTHCNAGALATGGYGTALGVVRAAFANDPTVRVFADETRPRFQGARLTTWELIEDGIPVTLVADNMSGLLMRRNQIQFVVVGADRITANGDTANKIGTYNLALVAQAHGVPFYVAAPLSTIDLSLQTGDEIPIEERDPEEVSTINGNTICATGTEFLNPAFDITPAHLIAGIITEQGIARPPYIDSIAALFA